MEARRGLYLRHRLQPAQRRRLGRADAGRRTVHGKAAALLLECGAGGETARAAVRAARRRAADHRPLHGIDLCLGRRCRAGTVRQGPRRTGDTAADGLPRHCHPQPPVDHRHFIADRLRRGVLRTRTRTAPPCRRRLLARHRCWHRLHVEGPARTGHLRHCRRAIAAAAGLADAAGRPNGERGRSRVWISSPISSATASVDAAPG